MKLSKKIIVIMLAVVITMFTTCREEEKVKKSSMLQSEMVWQEKLLGFIVQNKISKTEKEAKEILKKYPKNTVALTILAYIEKERGNFDKAEHYYKKLIKSNPKGDRHHFNLAQLYFKIGDVRAIQEMETALMYKPEETSYMVLLGYYYSLEGDEEKSIKFAREVLKRDFNNVPALRRIGQYYMIKKDEKNAFKFLKLALKYAPDDRFAIRDLAGGYYYFEQYDEALKLYNRLFKENKATKHSYKLAGYCYYKKNEFEKAEKYIKVALKDIKIKTGHNIKTFTSLGMTYLQQNKTEEAEKLFNKAHRLCPEKIESLYGLGMVYFQKQEYSKSEMYLKKFIEQSNDLKKDYYNIRGKGPEDILLEIKRIKEGKRGATNENS